VVGHAKSVRCSMHVRVRVLDHVELFKSDDARVQV
jgi:hypothetical protein